MVSPTLAPKRVGDISKFRFATFSISISSKSFWPASVAEIHRVSGRPRLPIYLQVLGLVSATTLTVNLVFGPISSVDRNTHISVLHSYQFHSFPIRPASHRLPGFEHRFSSGAEVSSGDQGRTRYPKTGTQQPNGPHHSKESEIFPISVTQPFPFQSPQNPKSFWPGIGGSKFAASLPASGRPRLPVLRRIPN